jgi:hypothetical protein
MNPLKSLAVLVFAWCATLAFAADPPGVVGRLNFLSGQVSFAPAQGDVNLRVRRLAPDMTLEIATPSGAVVVKRPGAYRVSVEPSGVATTVAVRGGGLAEVYGPNSSLVVRDNQQVALSGAGPTLSPAPAADEFDQWAAARDQREDRVASTRYLPAETTGYEDLDQYGAWQTVPDYGAVWIPAAVPAGWAPYRYGHWVWISPWGWTWVDDAPWGFAPFHYGRWVWLHERWAWAPGRLVARPVYSPAMVAFIGGSGFSVSVGVSRAPAVGWVPLGWREPYRPWYRASPSYVQNVNAAHVTNVTNVTDIRYANRAAPSAVTVVSRDNFVAARPVQHATLRISERTLAATPVTRRAPVTAPSRESLAGSRPGVQPPAAVRTREAVAISNPPATARVSGNQQERPRVRVIARRPEITNQQAPAAQSAPAPATAESPRTVAQTQPGRQVGHWSPGPPPETGRRPTFDREMRASTASPGAMPGGVGTQRGQPQAGQQRPAMQASATPQPVQTRQQQGQTQAQPHAPQGQPQPAGQPRRPEAREKKGGHERQRAGKADKD